MEETEDRGHGQLIHHEGTKDTKNTKGNGAKQHFLFCFFFVSFVPSW